MLCMCYLVAKFGKYKYSNVISKLLGTYCICVDIRIVTKLGMAMKFCKHCAKYEYSVSSVASL